MAASFALYTQLAVTNRIHDEATHPNLYSHSEFPSIYYMHTKLESYVFTFFSLEGSYSASRLKSELLLACIASYIT